jgi:hypothetical protein
MISLLGLDTKNPPGRSRAGLRVGMRLRVVSPVAKLGHQLGPKVKPSSSSLYGSS